MAAMHMQRLSPTTTPSAHHQRQRVVNKLRSRSTTTQSSRSNLLSLTPAARLRYSNKINRSSSSCCLMSCQSSSFLIHSAQYSNINNNNVNKKNRSAILTLSTSPTTTAAATATPQKIKVEK